MKILRPVSPVRLLSVPAGSESSSARDGLARTLSRVSPAPVRCAETRDTAPRRPAPFADLLLANRSLRGFGDLGGSNGAAD